MSERFIYRCMGAWRAKVLIVCAVLIVLCPLRATAQAEEPSSAPQALRCADNSWIPFNAPYYYCDCRMTAQPFGFPLDVLITDTVWLKADANDLLKGLSAYWFADCSVEMEVYAMCASKTPTLTMRVGKNQMREMDATSINDKLASMGELGETVKNMTPRIRVYPIGGGQGRVMCYPYNEGPHSTCTDLLPIYTSMTYVSSHTYDVYELQPQTIPSKGELFVQWKEKTNSPCTVKVLRGGCEGTVVATTTLSDSTKLYFPDKTMLQAAKKAGESLYFRFEHAKGTAGRINFRVPKYVAQQVDTTVCQGKGLQLADTLLTETTVYPNDTVWEVRDTVAIRTYHLTVTPPEPQYDTLRVRAAELPRLYREKLYIAKDGYGDYRYTEHKDEQCDALYLLHVEHAVQTTWTTVDTTLCQGKIYTFAGKNYTEDTEWRDTVWTDDDTRSVVDLKVTFTAPELEYDTLYLTQAELYGDGAGYYYESLRVVVTAFGDMEYEWRARNKCTRVVRLTVIENKMTGVEQHKEQTGRAAGRYNLLGQRVGEDYRGVVIENGRLVWRE